MVVIIIMGHLVATIDDPGDITGRRVGVGPVEQVTAALDGLDPSQELRSGVIAVMGAHCVSELDPADLAGRAVARESGDQLSAVIADVA